MTTWTMATTRSPLLLPRHLFHMAAVLSALITVAGVTPDTTAADRSDPMIVYIGTYASAEDVGIHILGLDRDRGELTILGGITGVNNPSFQALHPNGRTLYSVSESSDFDDQGGGAIISFAVEDAGRTLRSLNAQPSRGAGPCHVAVDHAGRHVLAANYGGGSVVVLPIRDDGSLDPPSAFVQHQGSSVHPRQQGPHAHSVTVDPADRFVMSADLGLDQVLIYRYDNRRGTLTPHELMSAANVTPGAGPRHFTFHPGGRFAYVINELNSTVTAFRFNADRGTLEATQEISTLPDDFQGENTTAEVAVSPNGRFLYGSNRGHNSIVVYAIDTHSGRLTHVSHHATGGEIPRNFAIDPIGTFLLAANQRTGNVIVFRIDPATGQLIDTGFSGDVPQAVCVTFVNDTP